MATVDRHPTRRRRGWLVAAILAIIVALILAGLGISIVMLDPLRSGSGSVFGIARTSEVDLGYAVEAFNPPEDPLTVCPG